VTFQMGIDFGIYQNYLLIPLKDITEN